MSTEYVKETMVRCIDVESSSKKDYGALVQNNAEI